MEHRSEMMFYGKIYKLHKKQSNSYKFSCVCSEKLSLKGRHGPETLGICLFYELKGVGALVIIICTLQATYLYIMRCSVYMCAYTVYSQKFFAV